MIVHPLSGYGAGDFDNQDIVDADGGYGEYDHNAFYEMSGDFGTLGEEEINSSELGYGEEYDLDGFGFRKKIKKITKKATKPLARITKPIVAAPKKLVPKIVKPLATIPKGVAKAPKKFQKVGGRLGIPKLGKSLIKKPTMAAKKKTVPKKIGGILTKPKIAQGISTVPQRAAPMLTQPSVSQSQVVSTGGQLTTAKLDKAAVAAGVQAGAVARSAHVNAHPLLVFSQPMGDHHDNEMGFLKDLFKSATDKAKEEAKKMEAKLKADLQARTGEALSSVSSTILQKPQVQAALTDKAKQSAAHAVAQKLLDPEVQKKAAIGGAVGLGIAGILAYMAFKRD